MDHAARIDPQRGRLCTIWNRYVVHVCYMRLQAMLSFTVTCSVTDKVSHTGHHSCLGRTLATDTMRFVVARVLQKYRFRFAPGDDGTRTLEDMKDQFTSNPGALQLYFELR
jgi:cytochrome P450